MSSVHHIINSRTLNSPERMSFFSRLKSPFVYRDCFIERGNSHGFQVRSDIVPPDTMDSYSRLIYCEKITKQYKYSILVFHIMIMSTPKASAKTEANLGP